MPLFMEPLAELFAELPANHKRIVIPGGEAGTAATIKEMQKLVSQAKRDHRVHGAAGEIIASCPPKDHHCYVKALYEWCRDNVQYAFDPYNVEYIENPVRVLEMKHPVLDCDSNCVLLASFCETLGYRTAYVTIKADTARPDEFSHVYLKILVPKHGWIAADPTMPTKSFGWEAPGTWPRKFWHGSLDSEGESLDDKDLYPMSGLGCGCNKETSLGGLGGLAAAFKKPKCEKGGYTWAPCPGSKAFCLPFGMRPSRPTKAECDKWKKSGTGPFEATGTAGLGYDPMTADLIPVDPTGGIGAFGEVGGLSEELQLLVESVWKGDVADELTKLRTENMEMRGKLAEAKDKIQAMPEGPEKSRKLADWQRADAASLQSLNTTHAAIAKYNTVAGYIETAMRSAGVSSSYYPRQLGIEPMTLAVIAALTYAAATAIGELAKLIAAARGQTISTKSLSENIADIIGGTSKLLTTAAIVAGVGLAGYMLFQWRNARRA